MTISGSYLATGFVSWVHCLLATSVWNSGYSPSLSWTRLSLRKDQPLIASETVSIKLNLRLWGCTGSLLCGGLSSPFLVRSFFGAIYEKKKTKAKDTSILAKLLVIGIFLFPLFFLKILYYHIYIFPYTHTHTHTHTYMYAYIFVHLFLANQEANLCPKSL